MPDFLIVDPQWLALYRTDLITKFFKFFPFFGKFSFLLTLIAVGYWSTHYRKICSYLGFLVPFTDLFNNILKFSFQIPRPDPALHLITAGSYGFPSGDSQIAVVVWGSFLIWAQHTWLKVLSVMLLILIPCSRVYLGVHSIYDVLGSVFFGSLTLYLFYRPFYPLVEKWYKGQTMSY